MKKQRTDIDGTIHHVNAVRLFVQGSGSLELTLHGLPDDSNNTTTQSLVNLTLSSTQRKSQTQLSNFKSENASLEIAVDSLGDWFSINTLSIFTRPVETGYPQ